MRYCHDKFGVLSEVNNIYFFVNLAVGFIIAEANTNGQWERLIPPHKVFPQSITQWKVDYSQSVLNHWWAENTGQSLKEKHTYRALLRHCSSNSMDSPTKPLRHSDQNTLLERWWSESQNCKNGWLVLQKGCALWQSWLRKLPVLPHLWQHVTNHSSRLSRVTTKRPQIPFQVSRLHSMSTPTVMQTEPWPDGLACPHFRLHDAAP